MPITTEVSETNTFQFLRPEFSAHDLRLNSPKEQSLIDELLEIIRTLPFQHSKPIPPELIVLLLEFVILGKPIPADEDDQQLLDAWKQRIREAAMAALQRQTVSGDRFSLYLAHYFDLPFNSTKLPLDGQKIRLPILEALQGILYDEGRQIIEFTSSKRNLRSSFRIRDLSPILADGLYSGQEFVHLVVKSQIVPENDHQYTISFDP